MPGQILPDLGNLAATPGLSDPTELALPALAVALLPEIFVGLTLAVIFAATVSTADSQIILCASVITQDMAPRWRNSYAATKLATLAVLGFGVIVALMAPETVFALVLVSWSGLGATLGPVLFVRLWRWPLPDGAGVAMMTAGLMAVITWQGIGLSGDVFAILPGAAAAFGTYGSARALGLVRRSSGRWRPRQESNL